MKSSISIPLSRIRVLSLHQRVQKSLQLHQHDFLIGLLQRQQREQRGPSHEKQQQVGRDI